MKRAIIVGASTVTGLAAVLLANPDGAPESLANSSAVAQDDAAAASASEQATGEASASPSTDTGSTADSGSPSASSSATADSSDTNSGTTGSSSGTFAGEAVQVRNFGTMQVQITTSAGKVTDVTALQVPDWDNKSQMINSYAVPQLTASALKAQSADVSYVSGATFTSMAFAQSLQSALTKAGLA